MRDDIAARDAPLDGAPPAVSFTAYAGTYLGLLLLATGSLLLAHLHLGGLTVALSIAGMKAVLVLWFFMHLSDQSASSRLAVLVAATLIGTLALLTALDVMTRHTFPARAEPPPSSGFYQRRAP
jgi:caa(3)-type oxidase subunit IV